MNSIVISSLILTAGCLQIVRTNANPVEIPERRSGIYWLPVDNGIANISGIANNNGIANNSGIANNNGIANNSGIANNNGIANNSGIESLDEPLTSVDPTEQNSTTADIVLSWWSEGLPNRTIRGEVQPMLWFSNRRERVRTTRGENMRSL